MSKSKVDLDFSDISTPPANQLTNTPVVKQDAAPAEKVAPKPEEVKEIKPLGYTVAIDGPEPGSYRFKDLSDLTGEEFLEFAHRVFPGLNRETANPRDFDTRQAKSRAFEQILRFHQSNLFSAKKGEKGFNH